MRTKLTFLIVLLNTFYSPAQTIEAETGTLSGTNISTQGAGYSGSGFVTGFDADGDKVTLSFRAKKGTHKLSVRYASPSGDKFNFVYVNGENMGSVAFPSSMIFRETEVGTVYLREGSNTIAIVKDWGYFDLDNIKLEASLPAEIQNVAANLVTPVPSHNADSVYNLLAGLYGKVILSGQYGGATEFNHIKEVSGKTPAIRGFDLIDYSPSRVEHGASSSETEKAIEWSRQRGMVTFCWHWNAPTGLIDQPGKEWWRGFYSEATTFDISKAMNDAGSEERTLILRDIDVIAVQLKELADANVPVLWRPLHEAEGKWFWWGAKGAEPCKWLWKFLFDRLVNHHQLNNLIWVWTSTGTTDALNWYPGDEYVDMIGADIYLPSGSYGSNLITFDNLAKLYEGRKIIALSENGTIPDPEKLFKEGAAWGWFSTWSGDFITDGAMNTEAHIDKVFNHDYVITLDEIDDLDAIIALLEERKEHPDELVTRTEEVVSGEISFQNPIRNDRLVVKVSGPARINIYDLQGRIEFPEENVFPDTLLEFDFRHKRPGIYLLKVNTATSVKVYRLIRI
jgi:mannan endo-1,4-beta-mannosidase